MKKKSIALLFILSLFYCPGVLANGGGFEPRGGMDCKTIPDPDYDGPLIQGTFTAAYDKSQCSGENDSCRHYDIHILLEGIKFEMEGIKFENGRETPKKKLYSLHTGIRVEEGEEPKNLCDYISYDLKKKFKYAACSEGVAAEFGFTKKNGTSPAEITHYPVLTDVLVTQKNNCQEYGEAVISGIIKIRMSKIKNPE